MPSNKFLCTLLNSGDTNRMVPEKHFLSSDLFHKFSMSTLLVKVAARSLTESDIFPNIVPCAFTWLSSRLILSWASAVSLMSLASSALWFLCSFCRVIKFAWWSSCFIRWPLRETWIRCNLLLTSRTASFNRSFSDTRWELTLAMWFVTWFCFKKQRVRWATWFSRLINLCSCWSEAFGTEFREDAVFLAMVSFREGFNSSLNSKQFSAEFLFCPAILPDNKKLTWRGRLALICPFYKRNKTKKPSYLNGSFIIIIWE